MKQESIQQRICHLTVSVDSFKNREESQIIEAVLDKINQKKPVISATSNLNNTVRLIEVEFHQEMVSFKFSDQSDQLGGALKELYSNDERAELHFSSR